MSHVRICRIPDTAAASPRRSGRSCGWPRRYAARRHHWLIFDSSLIRSTHVTARALHRGKLSISLSEICSKVRGSLLGLIKNWPELIKIAIDLWTFCRFWAVTATSTSLTHHRPFPPLSRSIRSSLPPSNAPCGVLCLVTMDIADCGLQSDAVSDLELQVPARLVQTRSTTSRTARAARTASGWERTGRTSWPQGTTPSRSARTLAPAT